MLEIKPVYHTHFCRESRVWHDTGIVWWVKLKTRVVQQEESSANLVPAFPGSVCSLCVSGCSCMHTENHFLSRSDFHCHWVTFLDPFFF